MDTLWIMLINGCLGVVLYWYIENEMAGEDGTTGVLALTVQKLTDAVGKFGHRSYGERVRVRDAAGKPQRAIREGKRADRLKGEEKAYRVKGAPTADIAPRKRYRPTTSRRIVAHFDGDEGGDLLQHSQ